MPAKKTKSSFRIAAALVALLMAPLLAVPPVSPAADPKTAAAENKKVRLNRALLKRYRTEAAEMKRAYAAAPSEKLEKRLEALGYKIAALRADQKRLETPLPDYEAAGAFLRDLTLRQLIAQTEEKLKTKPSRSRETVVYRLHERALRYVGESKFRDALQIYEEIILKDPHDDQAYLIMGHLHLLAGRYARSEDAFQNAVHINPENIHEISKLYENNLLQNPDDDMAYAHLGFVYLMLENYEKAITAFQDSLSINPKNERALEGARIIRRRLR